MIDPLIIAEAKRLLAEGRLSQRKIALRLHISRGTVGAVASGKRPDYEVRRRERDSKLAAIDDGPKVRCLGCGGLQSIPCRVCRDRRAAGLSKPAPVAESDASALQPNLHPIHRERYEQVQERRNTSGIDQTAGWQEPTGDSVDEEIAGAFVDDESEFVGTESQG